MQIDILSRYSSDAKLQGVFPDGKFPYSAAIYYNLDNLLSEWEDFQNPVEATPCLVVNNIFSKTLSISQNYLFYESNCISLVLRNMREDVSLTKTDWNKAYGWFKSLRLPVHDHSGQS